MTDSECCHCGSMNGLRNVFIDAASGPVITRTLCEQCAPGPSWLDTPGTVDRAPRRTDPEA
ncbi:hypothetical protein [Streptomyces sp. NPDC048644]|uniref:hypothetical protein n=1 Tax=Streptomyces sp. NPDC048644 TaxID=3365582 RepID=UPI0037138016